MRVLLDTNVLVRLADERLDLLTAALRSVLTAPGADIHVSVGSLWEIAIKHRLGKLALKIEPDELPALIASAGMTLLAIEAPHALARLDQEPPTRDPFDRLLLAQCSVEGLSLLTTDGALVPHPLAWRQA